MIVLNGYELTAEKTELIAEGAPCRLDELSLGRMAVSRAHIESALTGERVVYGVNTGFGSLKDRRIPLDQVGDLQHNLLLSHAAGVGQPLSRPLVRAMLALRINALAKGFSGIRPVVVERLVAFLNRDLLPEIPEKGSVGASGDLAPLAHLALPILGEGFLDDGRGARPANRVLAEHGMEPLALEAKEGLALINGTQLMGAYAALLVQRTQRLADYADMACAMTLEALLGSHLPFDKDVHALRPHPGQIHSARQISALLDHSEINGSHALCGQVQDAYSLRCAPQVHGAGRDALRHVAAVVETELNSVTDNPLVLADGRMVSAGHFHGQPLAIALDLIKIALAEWASISERRTERLVNPALSNGLPAFLSPKGGLHSGLMIAQYTAASLVSENKTFAHPASVDSIPTSANQEDHVSMGANAARHAWQVLENAERVLAIELLCAAQALDFRRPLKAGDGVEAAYRSVRNRVSFREQDRFLATDLDLIFDCVKDGSFHRQMADYWV